MGSGGQGCAMSSHLMGVDPMTFLCPFLLCLFKFISLRAHIWGSQSHTEEFHQIPFDSQLPLPLLSLGFAQELSKGGESWAPLGRVQAWAAGPLVGLWYLCRL